MKSIVLSAFTGVHRRLMFASSHLNEREGEASNPVSGTNRLRFSAPYRRSRKVGQALSPANTIPRSPHCVPPPLAAFCVACQARDTSFSEHVSPKYSVPAAALKGRPPLAPVPALCDPLHSHVSLQDGVSGRPVRRTSPPMRACAVPRRTTGAASHRAPRQSCAAGLAGASACQPHSAQQGRQNLP